MKGLQKLAFLGNNARVFVNLTSLNPTILKIESRKGIKEEILFHH
jgi:hypothetical protein